MNISDSQFHEDYLKPVRKKYRLKHAYSFEMGCYVIECWEVIKMTHFSYIEIKGKIQRP